MSTKKKLVLIHGEFSPTEAKQILTSIFSSKIQFHELRNFSSMERLGKEDKLSIKRIPQLKKSLIQIEKAVEKSRKQNKRVKIESEITISLID